jgi:mannose-1-phosphate guanylyltransferase
MDTEAPYALIMAGGSGTRFWPASRKLRPKQLLALAGPEPLLRQAVERLAPFCGRERVLISTGAHLAAATRALLPELAAEQFLIEPVGRNTAPCIGWAAAVVARRDPSAVVMAMPADPHIGDAAAFRRAVALAVESAHRGTITTIGVRPTHPETGYGYIEAAGPTLLEGVLRVARFVEKPDREHAEQFVATGRFFWNSGMFFFRAGDMLAAIRAHQPALAAGLAELDEAARQGREAAAVEQIFPTLPSVSIDFGVIEHVAELAVVPGVFGWSDIGSWLAAAELARRDEQRNSGPPGTLYVTARDNHVVDLRTAAGDARKVIALVGVADLVVVETDDALLVVHRDRAQEVKRVVEALKARGDEALT